MMLLNMAQNVHWLREIKLLIPSLCMGAVSGAMAGFIVSSTMQTSRYQEQRNTASTTSDVIQATSTHVTSTLELIPLERRAASPFVPPTFLNRRVSSVASLYRKPRSSDEHVLNTDKLIGQAVALTSDGWLVTAASVFGDARIADFLVWVDGAAYPIEHATTDSLTGAVFLKIATNDLTSAAFARVQDIGVGTELWVEARPGEFSPSLTLSTMTRVLPNEVISSEQASRRLHVVGTVMHGDTGAAAWDPHGSLVGINDGKEGERIRLIPASGIASSFASLLNRGKIMHAYLGIRAVDLASMRTDLPRDTKKMIGALIKDDKRTGKIGIQRDSPAMGKLKIGDIVLRVERDILDGSADLGEILAEYQPGTQVTVRVLRDGQDLDIPIQLGEVITSELIK